MTDHKAGPVAPWEAPTSRAGQGVCARDDTIIAIKSGVLCGRMQEPAAPALSAIKTYHSRTVPMPATPTTCVH